MSAKMGVYSGGVAEYHEPYIFPQENGNRTDVRWIAMTGVDGNGFWASCNPAMEFSVSQFSSEQLDRARHTYELVPEPENYLNLDFAQCGLGSASCGPGVFPRYWVPIQQYAFTLFLRPFIKN